LRRSGNAIWSAAAAISLPFAAASDSFEMTSLPWVTHLIHLTRPAPTQMLTAVRTVTAMGWRRCCWSSSGKSCWKRSRQSCRKVAAAELSLLDFMFGFAWGAASPLTNYLRKIKVKYPWPTSNHSRTYSLCTIRGFAVDRERLIHTPNWPPNSLRSSLTHSLTHNHLHTHPLTHSAMQYTLIRSGPRAGGVAAGAAGPAG
jgi:hypothetical protein